MCLTKCKGIHPFNRPIVAEEDIICYKALLPIYSSYYFITPIAEAKINVKFHMEFQIPYKAKKCNSILFFINHVLGASNKVTDGFIHTLSVCMPLSGVSLFKCIIPKGTKYFIGINNDYASEQIIFKEQLK